MLNRALRRRKMVFP